jgi:hypothetical protein
VSPTFDLLTGANGDITSQMDPGEFGGSGMRVKRMTASKNQPRRITVSAASVKRQDDGEAPPCK